MKATAAGNLTNWSEIFQMPLNGVVTNIIKLTVGRPRPFFLAACFPDGKVPADAYGRPLPLSDCTNTDAHVVSDSRHAINILNDLFVTEGNLVSRFENSSLILVNIVYRLVLSERASPAVTPPSPSQSSPSCSST